MNRVGKNIILNLCHIFSKQNNMKNLYLFLTIIGFIAPNIFVLMVSLETGNILLWLDPQETMNGMFSNNIATAFVIDLLVVVLIFFIWTYRESRKYNIKN